MLTSTLAAADVIVLDPGSSGLKVGTVVTDADRLVVPAGTRVTVVLPSGDTRILSGPHDAIVSTITKSIKPNAEAWGRWLKEIGSTGQSEKRTGGTRGATR